MSEPLFVNFRVGLKHPKLSWMIERLVEYGVNYRLTAAASGTMLQVQAGGVEIASEILNQELVEFSAVDKNNAKAQPYHISIVIDDLPNDHEYFEAQLNGGTLVSTEQVVADPDGATLTPVTVGEDDVVSDSPGLTWDFDDLDDEDEDESVGEIIDVEATVVEEGVPEPVGPPKKKKKKVKPEPQPASDPDFEAGTQESNDFNPVDGDEFLKVDEVLAFEDVTFPNVKTPIRMYDTDSSTLSAIGAKVLTTDPLIVTLYVRFKSGASVYRYNPVAKADFNSHLNLAIRRKNGNQEASIGSFFHHTIKVRAEEGTINCQKLNDENAWVVVLPKSERTKQIKATRD